MGYGCYEMNGRDQGYGVPCKCEHPDCNEDIDRGMGYACGGEPTENCGLFFCGKHLAHYKQDDEWTSTLCERCAKGEESFLPKPDVQEWIDHKLTDESWQQWRDENPEWVAANSK